MGKERLQSQKEHGSTSQVEDRVMKTAAQFFGEDLLTYAQVKGRVDQVAPTEHVHLEMRRMEEDDIKRMQSVLYALAVKFLKKDELEQVKEEIGMTILGQMIWDMGLEKGIETGIETGIEQGIQALILDNLEEGVAKERIIKKLILRFSLGESEARAFYDRFSADSLPVQGH